MKDDFRKPKWLLFNGAQSERGNGRRNGGNRAGDAASSHSSGFPAGTAMDNCGTGGDKSNSFNISTTSAFVLAAAGIPVAKHGNRSISSRSGSADVCQELGIDINLRPEDMTYLLEKVGIAFCLRHMFTRI